MLNPPIIRHFGKSKQLTLKEKPPVFIKDPETGQTEGPHELVTWGRGYSCVSTPTGLRWILAKWFLLTALDLTLSQMEVSLVARFLQLFLLTSFQMPTKEEIALHPTVNISSDAEDIHQNILNAAGEIEKGSED
ncbi:hypothetical protein HGM15179_020054 [Zosterops borbonicus]|uniref:Integrase-type domain-containing protein n=1 Tax=Zosterops borbonicus TaxID=364589 RepID=A0A8K1DAT0_9PASS|nr:hypothetical protein HGM15179_020054 [Zosterops borbonicus]